MGDNCQNDSKRFTSTNKFFNNSAIILQLMCSKKNKLVFQNIYVFKNKHAFLQQM